MTLFVAITAGLINILFAFQTELSFLAETSIKVFGLITTVAFIVMETRTALFWRHFQKRAAELEPRLNYRQYSTLPSRRGLVTAAKAISLLYFVVATLWLITIVFHSHF